MSLIVCRLLRRNERNHWVQFHAPVQIEFSSSGLILRESGTHLLLADCPRSAFVAVETLQCEAASASLFRMVFKEQPPMALAPQTMEMWDALYREIQALGIPVRSLVDRSLFDESRPGACLPNLQHPMVRRYVASLQLSPAFREFVAELEQTLSDINSIHK